MNRESFAGRPSRPGHGDGAGADSTTLREFWSEAPLRARLALGCAAISALAWLASFAGVMRYPPIAGPIFLVHVVVMALFLWHFVRLARHHWLILRTSAPVERGPRHPRLLLWAVAFSLVLLVAGFVRSASHGEGAPAVVDDHDVWMDGGEVVRTLRPGEREAFDADMLRAFAAAWLFFSLVIALHGRTVEHRIREMRDASGVR